MCGSVSITSSAVTCIYASHMHLLGIVLFRDNGVVSTLALTLTEIKVGPVIDFNAEGVIISHMLSILGSAK